MKHWCLIRSPTTFSLWWKVGSFSLDYIPTGKSYSHPVRRGSLLPSLLRKGCKCMNKTPSSSVVGDHDTFIFLPLSSLKPNIVCWGWGKDTGRAWFGGGGHLAAVRGMGRLRQLGVGRGGRADELHTHTQTTAKFAYLWRSPLPFQQWHYLGCSEVNRVRHSHASSKNFFKLLFLF